MTRARIKAQPWSPANATDAIREISKDDRFTLDLTGHAKDQMFARELYTGDVLHVLKNGFVYDEPVNASQKGCYKYKVESSTPTSPKTVRIIVIPWPSPPEIKIVTVMWKDEPMQ